MAGLESERALYNFVRDSFRYFSFDWAPGPIWKPEDFDFDRDSKRLGIAQGLSAAVNPNLRKFKTAGGKLSAHMGWNDSGVTPLPTVDYYETVERTLGRRAATQEFFRLFMIPGMNHCTGGDGAFAVDYLSYLEAWVEKGQAPDKLVGTHVNLEDLNPAERPNNPKTCKKCSDGCGFPWIPPTLSCRGPSIRIRRSPNTWAMEIQKTGRTLGPQDKAMRREKP